MKWFDIKFKFFFLNCYIVIDIFEFVDEICELEILNGDILVFYDVFFFFINVFLDEIIEIFVNRVFDNDWFNLIYDLNLIKMDFVDFFSVVIKG